MHHLRATLFAATATIAFSLLGGTAWAGAVVSPPSPSYQTNGRVETIAISGTTAYIGGKFTAVRPPGSPPGIGWWRGRTPLPLISPPEGCCPGTRAPTALCRRSPSTAER